MYKCVVKNAEAGFNGLHIFFSIIEEGVERSCAECDEQGDGIHRQFEIVKVKRGVVILNLDRAFRAKLEEYLRNTYRHGEVICFNCFEEFIEESTPGFVPVD
ncbi:hypothetical protein HN858_01905 [Candidatus Falkowbacteria bacterium]|jgi:hypothetical protein|nr:hypothetical protein [Candidatus Falkowbacteria bacterium]MBT5503564.1 hypothetical protein [Candidatus Falkowbacteria bacterium]MBT6573601.1 hypothetical protein [Candidatus Falkowbacteria bacterium]MBT7348409.1 hypothetical protein [Candidatus Falkowbacteria bacterium]MBT7500637.1 hypothetical protein [Candidatus Falkowbacteria bacterium]